MKPNRVATLNAGKFKAVLQCVKNSGTVLLMSLFLVIISCDKSDDLETVGNESPIENESPPDNETPPEETPPDNESPPDDESPLDETPPDEESPADYEPPMEKESIVIYTDIEPDFISERYNHYNLDLNNDQIIDFTVSSDSYESHKWLWIVSDPSANNGIISVGSWDAYAVPLNSGEEIFNLAGNINGKFYYTYGILGNCVAGAQDCFYDWKNKVDKYLGLRFIIKGQTHYGWARLDVTNLTQWVIKDYAYNATPDKPILAGQRN